MIPFYWLIPFALSIGIMAWFLDKAQREHGDWAAMAIAMWLGISAIGHGVVWGLFFFVLWLFGG